MLLSHGFITVPNSSKILDPAPASMSICIWDGVSMKIESPCPTSRNTTLSTDSETFTNLCDITRHTIISMHANNITKDDTIKNLYPGSLRICHVTLKYITD